MVIPASGWASRSHPSRAPLPRPCRHIVSRRYRGPEDVTPDRGRAGRGDPDRDPGRGAPGDPVAAFPHGWTFIALASSVRRSLPGAGPRARRGRAGGRRGRGAGGIRSATACRCVAQRRRSRCGAIARGHVARPRRGRRAPARPTGIDHLRAIRDGEIPPPPIAQADGNVESSSSTAGARCSPSIPTSTTTTRSGSYMEALPRRCSTRRWDAPCRARNPRARATRRSSEGQLRAPDDA